MPNSDAPTKASRIRTPRGKNAWDKRITRELFRRYKEEGDEGTASHMRQLTATERVGEIAQMLSGSDVSDAAIKNAQELLKNS